MLNKKHLANVEKLYQTLQKFDWMFILSLGIKSKQSRSTTIVRSKNRSALLGFTNENFQTPKWVLSILLKFLYGLYSCHFGGQRHPPRKKINVVFSRTRNALFEELHKLTQDSGTHLCREKKSQTCPLLLQWLVVCCCCCVLCAVCCCGRRCCYDCRCCCWCCCGVSCFVCCFICCFCLFCLLFAACVFDVLCVVCCLLCGVLCVVIVVVVVAVVVAVAVAAAVAVAVVVLVVVLLVVVVVVVVVAFAFLSHERQQLAIAANFWQQRHVRVFSMMSCCFMPPPPQKKRPSQGKLGLMVVNTHQYLTRPSFLWRWVLGGMISATFNSWKISQHRVSHHVSRRRGEISNCYSFVHHLLWGNIQERIFIIKTHNTNYPPWN